MDLIILIVVIIVAACLFKTFKKFIYIIGIIDTILRLLNLINLNINWPVVNDFINQFLPVSILAIINNNLTGIINVIAIWLYIICLSFFVYYIIRVFLKK
ncbi:MAG: hypothetical protein RSB72_01235, partial [Bacilli bacterium]